jgi:hypothetical protein
MKRNGGIGLGTILFIVFLILKLCGTINWSWWWVTSPIWIPFGFSIVIIIISAIFFPEELKQSIRESMKEK